MGIKSYPKMPNPTRFILRYSVIAFFAGLLPDMDRLGRFDIVGLWHGIEPVSRGILHEPVLLLVGVVGLGLAYYFRLFKAWVLR